MKVTRKNTTSGSNLILEGELTIYTVSLTHAKLFENHDEKSNPQVDSVLNILDVTAHFALSN